MVKKKKYIKIFDTACPVVMRPLKMWSCHWKYSGKGWITFFVRDSVKSVLSLSRWGLPSLTTQYSIGSGNGDEMISVSCSNTLAHYTHPPQEYKWIKRLEGGTGIPKYTSNCRIGVRKLNRISDHFWSFG